MSSDPTSARQGTGLTKEDAFRSNPEVSTFRSDLQETAGLLVGSDHNMEVDNSAASSSSFGNLSHSIRHSNLVPVGPRERMSSTTGSWRAMKTELMSEPNLGVIMLQGRTLSIILHSTILTKPYFKLLVILI